MVWFLLHSAEGDGEGYSLSKREDKRILKRQAISEKALDRQHSSFQQLQNENGNRTRQVMCKIVLKRTRSYPAHAPPSNEPNKRFEG